MNTVTASRGAFSMDALEAAIWQVPGVTHLLIRVNEEDTEVDGIPGHTIAAYVNNGDADLVAEAIWRKKPPGIGTFGTLTRTVTDEQGNTHTVQFSRPTPVAIGYGVVLHSYDGFDTEIVTAAIKVALLNYSRNLPIGASITVPQLYGLIYQAAGNYASTFAITDLYVTGSHGVERQKLTPGWNTKLTTPSYSSVIVTVNT